MSRASVRPEEPEPTTPKRHQAPSRVRYAATHPARTVRFKREADEKILALSKLLDVSYNMAANIVVNGFDDAAIEAIRADGHAEGFRIGVSRAQVAERAVGYAQAKQTFCLSFPCPFCGHPVELRKGDVLARFVLGTLVASGLGHQNGCPELLDKPSAPPPDVR